MSRIESVCVYCGSGNGNDPAFVASAEALGAALAAAGIRLVYGGGSAGLMGAVANAVLAGGGRVTGIIPQFLVDRERAHKGLSDLVVTADMHERKWAMFENADAFVALPGGIGTLEELIEIMTWAQLGRHAKPIVVLDVNGFWRHLKSLLDHMNAAGFLHSIDRLQPIFVENAEAILPALLTN
jgi:uncharacterized protein (TIGR00730 family)